MNGETKLILDALDEHRKEARKELKKHGEGIATLVERSKNQKDRLDRVEKKSAVISAITGSFTALGVVIAKTFGFDG